MDKYYIHDEMWDAITYPFPYINDTAVEGWVWTSNFIPQLTGPAFTNMV